MTQEKYIHMGTCTRPHGIKGEICVDWYADSPEFLHNTFYLQAGTEPLRVVSNAAVRLHKGKPLLSLPHVEDRTAAEALRGTRIYVDRDTLPSLSEDEAYMHDIVGMEIVDHASGAVLGVLEAMTASVAQDIWIIRAPTGQEILMPAVEEFIVSFDLEVRTIRVVLPSGLLEIYLS